MEEFDSQDQGNREDNQEDNQFQSNEQELQVLDDNVVGVLGSVYRTPRNSLSPPRLPLVLVSPRNERIAGELEEDKIMLDVCNVAVDNGDLQEKTVQVLTPGDQATPSQLSEPTVDGSESAEAGYAVMFPAEETKDIDLLNKFLLPPQKAMCSDELQDKITKFLVLKKTTGIRYNAEVRNRKECWNPDILGCAVTYQYVDDEGSCFRKDMFDSHGYGQSPVGISSGRVLSQMLPLGVCAEDSGIMPLLREDSLASSDGVSISPFLSMVLSAFPVLLIARSFFSHLLNKVQVATAKRKIQKSGERKGQVVTFREVGKLCVSNKEIGKGSNGTIVLEGVLREDKHRVAVKRLLKSHFDVLPTEVESLRAADAHPNVVRYYFMEEDDDFLYLALEKCTCSLHDLIISFSNYQEILQEDTNNQPLLKANGYPSPFLIKLMRDVVRGLTYLHKIGILHRDLKPKNVLVQKDGICCAKLSDMGISKHLPAGISHTSISTGYGSRGWQAPEQLLHQQQTCAVDVFNLGILFYFCMTGGRHPFGERSFEQDFYIVRNHRDLSLINHIPEAAHLVSSLLGPVPNLRPTAVQVLDHPFFWDAETRLSFIRDASDRFRTAQINRETLLLQELETTAPAVFGGGNWSTSLHISHYRFARAKSKYQLRKVHSLLRLIRNTMNHFGDLPNDVQSIVGKVADDADVYFSTRYPRLIMEVYKVLYSNCLEEPKFSKYF